MSSFLALLLILNLWNGCSARRTANQLVEQVESVEGKTNGLMSEQEEMKNNLDELKTSVDNNCGD